MKRLDSLLDHVHELGGRASILLDMNRVESSNDEPGRCYLSENRTALWSRELTATQLITPVTEWFALS